MKQLLRKVPFFVLLVKKVRQTYHYIKNFFRLKKATKKSPLNIVVGSSGIFNKGWTYTDIQYLNLLKLSDWNRFFQKNTIDSILAEHVWEHLSLEEGLKAAKYCFAYLKPGGYLRIAVPDGNHPDQNYINHVNIGTDDHKVLYNFKSFSEIFHEAGFSVNLLEYFDDEKKFHFSEWDINQGMIYRSKRFDKRNVGGKLNYTSIILDAKKII